MPKICRLDTDTEPEVRKLADHVARIRPDRVQLNTVTRPPADSVAKTVSRERLEELAGMFTPRAEVIAEFREQHLRELEDVDDKQILDMLRRRPCSIEDIANGMRVNAHQAAKHVEELLAANAIEPMLVGHTTFYQPKETS